MDLDFASVGLQGHVYVRSRTAVGLESKHPTHNIDCSRNEVRHNDLGALN